MQLVIFLPIFNALYMRLKIRCDGWKRKYFGYALQMNAALIHLAAHVLHLQARANSYATR
jgi:hypothetical protein